MTISTNKPRIAITIGDPAGIGPEIVVKALADSQIYAECEPIVIGDLGVMQQACAFCNLDLQFNCISAENLAAYQPGSINLIDLQNIDSTKLRFGEVQAIGGKAAYEYIAAAIALALQKKVAAVATAPINKEALKAAKIDYIGHTEIFETLCNSSEALTMFETKGIRTFFLSRHVSLRQACDLVTYERVFAYIKKSFAALKELGITAGSLAVAGLNPHCGEHGLFGDEELTAIFPAIREAQNMGYQVIGPIAADSIFYLAQQNNFAGILSLYHDQGHIGMKTLDFERTVSVTCGLPFIRTSVDHGTSFDKAGKGIASPISMIEAINAACRYAKIKMTGQS